MRILIIDQHPSSKDPFKEFLGESCGYEFHFSIESFFDSSSTLKPDFIVIGRNTLLIDPVNQDPRVADDPRIMEISRLRSTFQSDIFIVDPVGKSNPRTDDIIVPQAICPSWQEAAARIKDFLDTSEPEEFEQLCRVLNARSPAFKESLLTLTRLYKDRSDILLQGEIGSGKTHIARELARVCSPDPFISVTLTEFASTPDLIRSELFGHLKGAFTGADAGYAGKIALVEKGTLFLDEIVGMPLQTQLLFHNFLQSRQFQRIRETDLSDFKGQIVFATNHNLRHELEAGRLDQAFYSRINVASVQIPGLNKRREEIPSLAFAILNCASNSGRKWEIDDSAMDELVAFDFTENIRQLENILDQARGTARYKYKIDFKTMRDTLKQFSPYKEELVSHKIQFSIEQLRRGKQRLVHEFELGLYLSLKENFPTSTKKHMAEILGISPRGLTKLEDRLKAEFPMLVQQIG